MDIDEIDEFWGRSGAGTKTVVGVGVGVGIGVGTTGTVQLKYWNARTGTRSLNMRIKNVVLSVGGTVTVTCVGVCIQRVGAILTPSIPMLVMGERKLPLITTV